MKYIPFLMKLIELVEKFYAEYKRKQRQKAIDEILDNPTDAWDAKFGRVQSDSDEADK